MKSENIKKNSVKKEDKKVLKKEVKWPDKKYMVKYSVATFVTIIVCSLYFYLITVVFALIKELR